MTKKRTVMLRVAILVEADADEAGVDYDALSKTEWRLKDAIDEALGELPNELGWLSTRYIELGVAGVNSGRCAECGAWVTDVEKPEPISGLQNGATVDGRLLCDDHLPENHRWAF